MQANGWICAWKKVEKAMYKVFLGVGHGGKDPGAVGGGLKEKDVNLAIALACQNELAKYGVLVKLSRTGDADDPLSEEIRECNAFGPDLALDIHINAGGGKGFEVFHALAGGKGKGLLFKKGVVLGTYPYEELCDRLIALIESDGERHG